MSVKWHDSKAGYDPGQEQSLEITFDSRDGSNVIVKYKFKARSLANDYYTYDQRHNKATIWVGGESKSISYQLRATTATKTWTGQIKIANVEDSTTSLKVQYRNRRIWVDSPNNSGDPRSTGVVSKTTVGNLTIPSNDPCSIIFNKGYAGGSVSNVPSKLSIYRGKSYTIPSNILVDNKNHYVFNGGYTTDSSDAINYRNPSVAINSSRTASSVEEIFYACWKPQQYTYKFYSSSNLSKEYSKLKCSYLYTQLPIDLPNLNRYTSNNSDIKSEYYVMGYDFAGWRSSKGDVALSNNRLSCNIDSSTNFYPILEPITSKITFDYGFDNFNKTINYKYGTKYNFNTLLLDSSNKSKSITSMRPGYKFIGWTYDINKSQTIYKPFEAPAVNYKPTDSVAITYPNINFSNKQFKDNGITLYAVWEYYSTIYVYTNDSWHLALPYVYTGDSWHTTLSYIYNDSWKL